MHRSSTLTRVLRPLVLATFSLALGACDGGAGHSSTLSGTVATGAPVTDATITIKCQSGSSYSTHSNGNGAYSIGIPSSAFPCAVQASGGNLGTLLPGVLALYSFAQANGVANVTPLTDLATALQINNSTGHTLDDWFADPTQWEAVADALVSAIDTLRQDLSDAGYTVPSNWTAGSSAPFTLHFTPGGTDPYDMLLEAISAAIDNSGDYTDYTELLEAFANGMTNFPPPPDNPADDTLPAPDGDGAALGSNDGATGTVDTGTVTYTGHAGWGSLGASGYAFVAYKPQGEGFDATHAWRVIVPGVAGTYHCAEGSTIRVQLDTNYDTAPTGGSCTIEVISATQNTVTGRFSARFVHTPDGGDTYDQVTVHDGYFRISPATGGGQPLPEGTAGASFKLDGQTYLYTVTGSLDYEDFKGMTALPAENTSPGSPVGIQLNTLPARTGTFACDDKADGSNAYRKINVWFYWNGKYYTAGNRANPDPGPAGSSCSITITQAGSTLEGSFNGTFVNSSGESLVVTDGLFRYIGQGGANPGVPTYVSAMAGSYNTVVTYFGDQSLGYSINQNVALTIASNGDITVGSQQFKFSEYTASGTGTGREPSYRFTLSDNQRLTIYVDGNTPVGIAVKPAANSNEMTAGVRPLSQQLSTLISDLLSHSPFTLTNISDPACPTFTLTMHGNGTSLNYQSPAAYESYGDSYTRFVAGSGVRSLKMYYSRIALKDSGVIELYPFNGNGNEYGVTWTTDAAAIAAACNK